MKMVIVFATEDRDGMKNTVKIVDELARPYVQHGLPQVNKRNFGKIEFIKMLRAFAQEVKSESQDDTTDEDGTGLRFAKVFSEKVWDRKEGGERY